MSKTAREVFEAILAQMKEDALENRRAYYTRAKDEIAQLSGQIEKEIEVWSKQKYGSYPYRNERYKFQRELLKPADGSCCYSRNTVMAVRPDADNVIEKRAQDDVKAMFEGFIVKQTRKTDGILKGRGCSVEGRVSGNLESYLNFKLEDGASFDMKTQIVWKCNQYGTNFHQFPTTFHNARKADGTVIKTPSEAKLKAGL